MQLRRPWRMLDVLKNNGIIKTSLRLAFIDTLAILTVAVHPFRSSIAKGLRLLTIKLVVTA